MFNFGLSSDQQALQAALRRYVDGELNCAVARRTMDQPERFSPTIWRGLASMGVQGLMLPEEWGGAGLGYVEATAAMECVGRVPLPVPCLETVTIADLIRHVTDTRQRARWLPQLATGEIRATYAVDEPGGGWNASSVEAEATHANGCFRLQGTKLWVAFANAADLVVCAVRTAHTNNPEDGITLLALEPEQLGLQIKTPECLDPTYELCELDLCGVLVPEDKVIGQIHQGWHLWTQARRVACVLASAQLVGGMEKCLELAVDYSKARTQFGKPIGSFQAIKHRCADMLTELEAVRGSVYYAAWALQAGTGDVDVAVSSAKAYASDAAVRVAEAALQLFGAIGFTWEHDIHLYLKRARRLQVALGDAALHRELIATAWL